MNPETPEQTRTEIEEEKLIKLLNDEQIILSVLGRTATSRLEKIRKKHDEIYNRCICLIADELSRFFAEKPDLNNTKKEVIIKLVLARALPLMSRELWYDEYKFAPAASEWFIRGLVKETMKKKILVNTGYWIDLR